jgi:hypothetical protein
VVESSSSLPFSVCHTPVQIYLFIFILFHGNSLYLYSYVFTVIRFYDTYVESRHCSNRDYFRDPLFSEIPQRIPQRELPHSMRTKKLPALPSSFSNFLPSSSPPPSP